MKKEENQQTYKRPEWVPQDSAEPELCPDCFKVVGDKNRYNMVCMLGKSRDGMTVTEITDQMHLTQPTITHHLQTLSSVDAVECEQQGRERRYKLNRNAHCFEECKIPY
jgi:predicted transcriptional regulator